MLPEMARLAEAVSSGTRSKAVPPATPPPPHDEQMRRVYEGIPFGSYLARFQLNDWYLQIPEAGADPMPIRIGPVPGQFTIDLSGLGRVQAVLKDSSGREYTGGVSLRLFNNQGTRFLSFHSAPYLVEGVPAGRYWLVIDRLPGADRQRQVATAFEVLPDEVVMPELTIVH